ncbi:unnamed protein product [Amoebophrya sp. A120]|nr:unnamed protein product [Amoebophrya sp. A120]|eukprot:GSA120T00010866001.1
MPKAPPLWSVLLLHPPWKTADGLSLADNNRDPPKPAHMKKSFLAPSMESRKSSGTSTDTKSSAAAGPPCACEATNPKWQPPVPRDPMCFFIDVGAGRGDSELAFLGEHGGQTSTGGQGQQLTFDTGAWKKEECLSYLVEPNSNFGPSLTEVARRVPGRIFPMVQQAAYMCDKQNETFYLDTAGPHARGSAIDPHHSDIQRQGTAKTPVNVTLVNLLRWLREGVLPEDHLVLKMDAEGAEWDIIPCLAKNPDIYKLIDVMYLEDHCPRGQYCCFENLHTVHGEQQCDPTPQGQCWCPSKGQAGNTRADFDAALNTLKSAGVKFPPYFSET